MTHVLRATRGGVALALLSCLAGGCATEAQVRQIVAETNAAMVSPYIDIADEQQGSWEAAVAEMDAIIDVYPDDKTLVNHLRVRQAMLFTVNGLRNWADLRWGLVVQGELKTERDRSLAACGTQLAWWYWAAPQRDQLDADAAKSAVTCLDSIIESTTAGSDVRVYLSTIRAQIVQRQGRDSRLDDPVTALPSALERYVATIGADSTWITGLDVLDLQTAKQIKAFRYRIWLAEIIGEYKQTAADLGLPEPVDWKPDWVKDVD